MCTVPLDQKTVKADRDHMKDTYGCNNDDARSMSICYGTKGTIITVFDNGNMKKDDDWATIEVEDTFSGCHNIGTFEKTHKVGDVSVQYRTTGNLDGKVSSFEYRIAE